MVVLFDVFIFCFFCLFVLFFDVAFDALFNRKLLRSTFLSKKKSSNNKCCASMKGIRLFIIKMYSQYHFHLCQGNLLIHWA